MFSNFRLIYLMYIYFHIASLTPSLCGHGQGRGCPCFDRRSRRIASEILKRKTNRAKKEREKNTQRNRKKKGKRERRRRYFTMILFFVNSKLIMACYTCGLSCIR